MEYNTTRDRLMLPEYGRNVQNMILHAMEIEDREERNKAARAIIEVMGQLNPHLRDVEDYRHKLWTHLFIMADFKIDVDSPYEIPTSESLVERPQEVEYPKSKSKYGHYGQYTQAILEGAASITDEDEKEYMTLTMANFMKRQYLLHNNKAVEDTLIANQLKELSNNELELDNPDEQLTSTKQLLRELGLLNNQNNTKRRKSNKSKRKYKR